MILIQKMINCSTIPICIKSKHDMTICEHCIRGHVEHFGSNHLLCSFEGLRMQGLEYLGASVALMLEK